MTSWSRGDVTLTISFSWTCSAGCSRRRSTGRSCRSTVCFVLVPCAGLPHVVLRFEHQRARRADADAVPAVDARRVRERDVELGRDVRVESAAGDGDRERVLRVGAARLDALVAEDATRVVAHVEIVVDLHRLGDVAVARPGRVVPGCACRGRGAAGGPKRPVRAVVGMYRSAARARGRPTIRAARESACGCAARDRCPCARPCRPRPCASTPGRAYARPRARRRKGGTR